MIQTPPRTIKDVFESLPQGTLAQIIQGNLIMTPAPDFWHQDVVTEISSQLRTFLKQKPIGRAVVSPVDVYFENENIYLPDIIFLYNEQMNAVEGGKVNVAPALIIEVLSPGTEKYDKTVKKKVYERSGVKEYWIVDPVTKAVLGYRLQNNAYQEIPSEAGILQSSLLGITIQF